MRRFFLSLLCVLLTCGGLALPADSPAAAAGKVSILLDHYPLPFPEDPVVINGTTMVPFRAIAEALGVQVVWNQQDKTIVATDSAAAGARVVVLKLGSLTATVDGAAVKLAQYPR